MDKVKHSRPRKCQIFKLQGQRAALSSSLRSSSLSSARTTNYVWVAVFRDGRTTYHPSHESALRFLTILDNLE